MEKEFLLTKEEKIEYWGEGEWVNEPDLITFEHHGIDCKIIRIYVKEPYSKEFCMFGGHLCGYCKIPKDHFWYEKSFDDIQIYVHDGLTYAENQEDGFWIGFDCAHSGDLVPSVKFLRKKYNYEIKDIFPLQDGFEKYAIFNPKYRNIEFCIQECKSMADQINEVMINE